MRFIKHPGNHLETKSVSVPTRAFLMEFTLNSGETLLDAIRHALKPYQVQSAGLRLYGGALETCAYYMPALSDHPEHAVYFSDRYETPGKVVLEQGSVTVGLRDGDIWLHCHAMWIGPDGRVHCGHLIPDEVRVKETIAVKACLLLDACFEVSPDDHTNFAIFKPRVSEPGQIDIRTFPRRSDEKFHDYPLAHQSFEFFRALALRIAPNQDLCESIAQVCRDNEIKHAQIFGGVGSTIGAEFTDGRRVVPFVTELFITHGEVFLSCSSEDSVVVDVSLVDYTGVVSSGRLVKGENPVLVTCELILVECQ